MHPLDAQHSQHQKPMETRAVKEHSRQVKKWMDSFRAKYPRHSTNLSIEGWPDGNMASLLDLSKLNASQSGQKQWDLLSSKSSEILGTPRTASISLASQRASLDILDPRDSLDSLKLISTKSIEDSLKSYAAKRRHVLHEILVSETNYVSGVKTLSDIVSALSATRPAILTSLQNIRQTHETFLDKLRTVSSSSQNDPKDETSSLYRVQRKFRAMDPVRTRSSSSQARYYIYQLNTLMTRVTADTSEVMGVLKELEDLCDQLGTLYEDYGSKHELLVRDMDIVRRRIPAGGFWINGIEALSASVESDSIRKVEENSKSMTLDDLLAKPLQRICKYPLLLQELMKNTPPTECAITHEAIKRTCIKVQKKVQQVNRATDNIISRDRIQKTMSLHDKLDYGDKATLSHVYQELGFMNLCGVLHVAYQSFCGVTGDYMACVLFTSYLLLARWCNETHKLQIFVSIYVPEMKVDPLSNGRVCYECPFSWKLLFKTGDGNCELIISAASALEERRWKTELLRVSALPPITLPTLSLEPQRFSIHSLEVMPFKDGDVPVGGLIRTSSIRSLSTRMSSRIHTPQLIIKKTHNPLHDGDAGPNLDMGLKRSRSVAPSPQSTILNPLRQDRIKLERNIADIYTREVLPYPGMTLARTDYLRTQTLIRRLSFRGRFNSRRSSSVEGSTLSSANSLNDGKEESLVDKSSEDGYSLRDFFRTRDEGGDGKELAYLSGDGMRFGLSSALPGVLNIRRRVKRSSSDSFTGKAQDTLATPEKPNIWKRWSASMPFFRRPSSLRIS